VFRQVFRLRHYERISIENHAFLIERGKFGPKFQVHGVVSSPTNHSSCRRSTVNVLSWAQVSFVLSQFARLTDRRTNRQTDRHFAHGQGCGLGLDVSVSRRTNVSSRFPLEKNCQRLGLVSVSAIYVSCPRPIFGHIVEATVRSVNGL